MILNISGRTDIVAFYSKWLKNRFKEGYVDVRNPFYRSIISRIYFKDVDGIVFCTKNPANLLSLIDDVTIPSIYHITLTPYRKDIEPNVPPKGKIIEIIKKLSKKVGKDKIWIRYDPVFINDTYKLDYHIKNFDRMCELLDGYTQKIIISFLDIYQNVRYNMSYLRPKTLTEKDYELIGKNFSNSAKKHGMTVQTCAEKHNLEEYGFKVSDCVTKEVAAILTGKNKFKTWTARKNKCKCVSMVDIGDYNTCNHMCRYCYANYNEASVKENIKNHDPSSSLLIGRVSKNDTIKIRTKS